MWRRVPGPGVKLAAIFILAVALLLRVYALDWGVPNGAHHWPYHPDESQIFTALPHAPLFHPYDSANGAIYFVLYGAHTAIGAAAGLYPLTASVAAWEQQPQALTRLYVWNRLLSAILGTLAVGVMYLVARQVGLNAIGALGSAALLAVLPLPVLISHFERPHTLAILLGLVTYLYLCKVVGGERCETQLAFWSVAATAAEYPLGILVLAGGIAVLWKGASLRRWAVGLLAVIPFMYNAWWSPAEFWTTLQLQQRFLAPGSLSLADLAAILAPAMSLTVLILAPLSFYFLAQKKEGVALLLVLAALGGVYIVIGQHFARRFSWLYPLVCLGMGALIGAIPRTRIALAVLGLLLLEPTLRTAAILRVMAHGDTRTEAAAWISSRLPEGTVIGYPNWFFVPHLSIARYRMVEIKYGQPPLADLPFMLTSDLSIPGPDDARRAGMAEIYRLERPHAILEMQFDDRAWPEDMRYTNPSVYLFQKLP